ncbi:tRNA (guanosine(46)-N7)-methyltransferase TrmB, partial [Fusobacterium sp.]|uniref:tRNA (guanosine(46)-N7)-methyltransferase TrmB n=1 Tax=Fusobacterium sp. TaxID=68766 RepID=UPI0034C66351
INVIYFPLDDRNIIRNILNIINLKELILIETELWPNIINEAQNNNARIILVNGRISDKSFGRYKKLKFLFEKSIKKIDYFYMQSAIDEERIIKLGADKKKVENIGNLKFDLNLEKYSKEEIVNFKKFLKADKKKIFVAGSTRTGEEEIILDVFKKLKNFLLVLVPRHLERIEKIEEMLKIKGFSYTRYSLLKNEYLENKTYDIILVDKMGVLRKFYAISDISFVGGTLVNIGGHSLLEPLFYKKTPLFGKYVQNILEISKEALRRKIAYQVETIENFLKAIEDINLNNKKYIEEIEKFFEENKLLSLKIAKKENLIMKNENINSTDEIKNNLWKHFFHSPKTNYNKYMYQLLNYPEYIIFDAEEMKKNKNGWRVYFKNTNPIAVEIGTGSGNFTSELALRNPNKNFIGLELRFKRLCLAANKSKKNSLKNIVFLRKRGEELEEFLGSNEIDEMYINFPDPWEGNEKNRIIQKKLFINLNKIMKTNGKLFFKTDHDNYYQDVLNLVNNLDNYEVIYHTNDLHSSEKAKDNIKTEFEQLFLNKHKKNINYIEILKKS